MAHRRAFALLLAALWLVLWPALAAAEADRDVPLVRLASGLWTVAVQAGPKARPWRFLVDTGSTHTLISPAAARRAGLVVRPGRHLRTPLGVVSAGETTIAGLSIGGRRVEALVALVVELGGHGAAEPIDGILGMDALTGDRLTLDLVAGTLAVGDADVRAGRPAGHVVPARVVAGRMLVDARVGGQRRTLVLDSGASHLVLFDDDDAGAPVGLTTAGGTGAARAGRAELALGDVRLGAVPTLRMASPTGRAGSDGLLPVALFASIALDRTAGELRVVPRR